MNFKRKGCLFVCLLSIGTSAYALFIHDPINYVQNKIIAVNSTKNLLNQVKEIKYQFSLYENDLKNMRLLKHNFWDNTKNYFQELKKIQNQGQALSYYHLNPQKKFNDIFYWTSKDKDFSYHPAKMSQAVFETIHNSFSSIHFQAKSFLEEEKITQRLHALSEASKGRMEALQTANLFSGMQISQLQKMRELLMNQSNVQNAVLAFEIKKEEIKNEGIAQWLKTSQKIIPKYGSSYGFGTDTFSI